LAVLKEARSIGEVVFIDSGENGSVPEAIRSQLNGVIPIVVIADPKGEKVYGRFDHTTLKTKDFNSIFRQAKKELREDLKNGVVQSAAKPGGAGSTPASAGGGGGSALKPLSTSKFANLPFEKWESLKGSSVEAKLEAVNGDDLTLKTKDGRTIKLKQYQLSGDSLRRLKQING
jgi:hypothetical protein